MMLEFLRDKCSGGGSADVLTLSNLAIKIRGVEMAKSDNDSEESGASSNRKTSPNCGVPSRDGVS